MRSTELKVEITELFMAKADFDRRFYGTVKREIDEDGNTILYGKILVKNDIHNGYIYGTAVDNYELSKNLDKLVKMILDENLHDNKSVVINGKMFEYNLN